MNYELAGASHITTSPHHHITTSSHHHIITSPHHHITTSSHHHIIISPSSPWVALKTWWIPSG
ncbi:MAG: hypothetical protein LBN98_07195 [Prevotellaceae bacterium]|jgi:hypothetical protein|nr:hypothetical protein [Prevotellaceae bacterium]